MPTSTATGRMAEEIAAGYLSKVHNMQLIDKNWRTRTCEIDLVMQKDNDLYFIEVKYRKNQLTGGGLSSITPNKHSRMISAAEEWLQNHEGIAKLQAHLSAIELTGVPPRVTALIEDL